MVTTATQAPAPGRKYRIERYLTEGGMGAIFLGKKLGVGGFEKPVVLKQLLPEFTSRPEFRDLFFREAKITASLDHVNIVRTFDLVASGDSLFIVMEHVRGTDLRTIAWRARQYRRPLSPRAVLFVATEILAGLAYAHGRRSSSGDPLGIIHRDVSPSNILCSVNGEVKLSDFGIAKAATFSSVFYRVRGKVGYMSPEQAKNELLDARSDLFSLAICIYETLLGQRIYTGDLETPPEAIYGQPIPPLLAKRPGLPMELETILRRGLSLERDRRFPDAAAFADALSRIARQHGLACSSPELAAELVALLGPDPEAWMRDTSGQGRVTERLPTWREFEGKEAQSIGVDDLPAGSRAPSGTHAAVPAAAAPFDLPAPAAAPPPARPPSPRSVPVVAAPFDFPAPLGRAAPPPPSRAPSRAFVFAGTILAALALLTIFWLLRRR